MTSITEDPSLPLDMDGTSNVFSGSYLDNDITEKDVSSSMSSELEHPGMHRNLTSAGKVSPHRTRTIKDQEAQLGEFKKENFGLKLRIYHLEEVLRRKWGDSDDGWKMNIELQVQLGNMKKELEEKGALLLKAKQAIDQMAAQHDAHLKDVEARADVSNQMEALEQLKATLAEREDDLDQAQRDAQEVSKQLQEMHELNDGLTDELRNKDDQLEHMQQELEDLQGALDARPHPTTTPRACQTVEPLPALLAQASEARDIAQADLADQQQQNAELKANMTNKDKQIKHLEMELLSSSQKLAAGADDYAREMQEQASELDRCRERLKDLGDKLREKEAELRGMLGEQEGTRQQAREADTLVQRLQPLVAMRDREIQDLQQKLDDAVAREAAKEEEMRQLKRRLKDAEARARQTQPDLDDKEREIKRLTETVKESDEELSRLRGKLRELEDALAHARRSAHRTGVDNREQNEALKKLSDEIEALKAQLSKQRDGARDDLEAALASKDAALGQMQRRLEELQSKLDSAEQTILQLTTSKAAELGVLRATIEDLNRQLEHLERLNRELRSEVGRLAGEQAGMEREINKLREQNRGLRDQVAALENELAEKNRNLSQAEQTIADLQKLIDDLQRRGHELGASQDELAALSARVALLERALRNKESEVEGLKVSLKLKERLIVELQEEIARLRKEGPELLERLGELEEERNKLEVELAKLQSQARISKLASEDLQSKLTQAFGEREELARKLQLAEEALREKDAGITQCEVLIEHLRKQIEKLKRQLEDLTHRTPPHTVTVTTHETTTTQETDGETKPSKDGKSSNNSTTMIFGSVSDSILLNILQKLQELSAEITAGRTDSHIASSSLSSKLEHLTVLQRHLEESLKDQSTDGGATNVSRGDTHYTSYYFGGVDEEGETSSGPDQPASSTPKKPSPRRLSSDLTATKAALRDATEQVGVLQSELAELKQWNNELQRQPDATQPPPNYNRLEGEVDRLVAELDAEREKSKLDKAQQQKEFNVLQKQLKGAEKKVAELEAQLRLAIVRDAGTSTEERTSESLRSEIEKLVRELDEARATIAALQRQLHAEKNETDYLRMELHSAQTAPPQTEELHTSFSSMPNLHSSKNLSESWTSPAKASSSLGEQPDVRELRRKHEEVTRLNQELQRKCEEKLHHSPSSSRPSSGNQSTAYWQGRLRDQEERLRTEMLNQERSLLAQIRETEMRAAQGDTELRSVKRQLADMTTQCTLKDEEMHNLSRALAAAETKIAALEEQLASLLRDKNTTIVELEERLVTVRDELRRSQKGVQQLRRNEGGAETEVTILHETVDSLTQQLTARIEDIEELERKIRSLEEGRTILNSQLAAAQEQVLTLREELVLYQKLLNEKQGSTSSVDLKQVLQLLEEIHRLRDQLDQSIRSNQALSEQLQSRLEQTRSETTLHITSGSTPGYGPGTHTTPPSSRRTTHSQTTPTKKYSSHGTSPRVKVTTHSTTRVPVSTRSTSTKGQRSPGQTTISLHYDSESGQSFSETKLSDMSTSSLSQSSPSTRHSRPTAHVSTSTATFTSPKDSSMPHVRHNDTLTRSSKLNASFEPTTSTDGHDQNHSTNTSRFTRTKTISTSRRGADLPGGGASGESPHQQRRPEGRTTFSWSGTGDFTSLETRLQEALNSPSLPAADRSFLEDLLHYLRQQRSQLDDSRKLLERLEQSSIPPTTHIHVDTAESGTLPTLHTHTGSQATHPTAAYTQTTPRGVGVSSQTTPTKSTTNSYTFRSESARLPPTSSSETYTYAGPPRAAVNGSGARTGRVDLSKLYEQLLQTHSSLAEARSSLNKQRKQ